jgi:hypothetical protein
LEALLLAGEENAVAQVLLNDPVGIAEERRRYPMKEAARRDRDLAEQRVGAPTQRIPPVGAVLRELGFRVKSWD